ncbi:hypothetical protein [Tsukamurella ocularis]|uniref:hypothetical protein n=1 Tax=Tsukamurella ocularis TaxID=1970234 RepID=UPI00216A0DAB|nr:hypothetical protein [Tsukamurella ocularis]MCS3778468.1 hypothetical protein [Tsukamurella ocularis]MCS3789169.1 hypothetical protein [Tsukamurella ocularis]MCS3853020.1 hypothetical protein [Tsukamurella ocularis]
MAEQTVDQMLDAGADCLQYFKAMLDIAKWLSQKIWPDWRDHVCRDYDNERGIDLASLRGDAVMLRQQATAARQAVTDQSAARTSVQTAWPDNAGRAAVTTLDAQQRRSEPVATVLERTAAAAESVPGAVLSAVKTKTDALSEFASKEADAGVWVGVMRVAGLVVPGVVSFAELNAGSRERFEAQLAQDLARFDQINAAAVSAVQAAYATVPAAAKGIDASAFPAPSFGTITATTTQTTTSPTTASPVTSGGGGGSGSPTTPSPSSTSPTSTSPSSTTPTSTSPTSPSTTGPTTTGTTTSPTTTGASTAPSNATPSTGTGAGTGTGSGTPSWLSQLLPKLTEALSEKDKTGDGKGTDSTGDKGTDKAGDRGMKGEKVLGVDALGRTVTATLSPDGKTVEVTAKKPDGTVVEKATLKVGEDGKLTAVNAEDGADKGEDGTGKAGDAKPADAKPATQNGNGTGTGTGAATGSGATPAAASPSGTGGGTTPAPSTGGGAAPAATPGPVVPVVPAAPVKPKNNGAQDTAPAVEPCPPAESADQGTGAEFAVSGS